MFHFMPIFQLGYSGFTFRINVLSFFRFFLPSWTWHISLFLHFIRLVMHWFLNSSFDNLPAFMMYILFRLQGRLFFNFLFFFILFFFTLGYLSSFLRFVLSISLGSFAFSLMCVAFFICSLFNNLANGGCFFLG